jgi:hydroxymethylglutaryl-CoA lyase
MPCVEIVEIGPRDGLHNEAKIVSIAQKVEWIDRAIAAGVRRIGIASFVNPARVPQMAVAEEVVAQPGAPAGVTRIGLVMNERGEQHAIACGIDQLGAVTIASNACGIRNQGQDSAQSVEVASGMARRLAACGPAEIVLADTIGVAVPAQVTRLVAAVRAVIGEVHMQNRFPKLSATPSGVHCAASRVPGENNAEVYGERLGLDVAILAEPAARGIVRCSLKGGK